jgi:hypothetical protein
MQKTVLIALAVVGTLTAGYFIFRNKPTPSNDPSRDEYNQWKVNYNISVSTAEDDYRYSVWTKNYAFYNASNAQGKSYTLGINGFTHLTQEEFAATYLGYKAPKTNTKRNTTSLPLKNLKTSVDWTSKLNAIKNQQQCGSCWAFSAVGSVEAIWSIQNGVLKSLSEQQLVDCSDSYGNEGCNGGSMDAGFQYIIDSKGIALESEYPYTAADGTCQTGLSQNDAISSFTDVTANSADALKAAIAQQPVSIAIEADQNVFQGYTSGILNDASCGTNLDHGVVAVGYDDTGSTPYYIVRNSWGTAWGEAGYVRIFINGDGDGICGIQMAPSYPTI